MKAIYLDCFSGISGNMLLGALIRAGVPENYLCQELQKLPFGHEFRLQAERVSKQGIDACYVHVDLTAEQHDHEDKHSHHHHHHRTMASIRQMIETSSLNQSVKEKSLAIFSVLAEAEGHVHGRPADEVAFHEVGAVDSLVDIIGTAICLDYLGIEAVFASKINTGSGFVQCAHGLMPVPAPAVAELLAAWPVYAAGEAKELTTPTGAAVVKALAKYAPSRPDGFLSAGIAYGAGSWELSHPNVLRLYWGEYEPDQAERPEKPATYCLLETNIDDMNPQLYSYVLDKLLSAGALDAWTESIVMKKGRPAQKLSVLCRYEKRQELAEILFAETTTIGLRVLPLLERPAADRLFVTAATPYGEIACKVSSWRGRVTNISAEYEDCRQLAKANHVPLKKIQQLALAALPFQIGDQKPEI